jgi:intergrase/recombinase
LSCLSTQNTNKTENERRILELIDADRQLAALIERRASREPDPDELEPSYAESVRRYHEGWRRANRLAWIEFHRDQAERLRRTMTSLIAEHEAKAQALLGEGA